MDAYHILLGRPCQFDNDIAYQGWDNTMMPTWCTHKIVLALSFHFDKNPGGKNSSFLVMMQGEKELDEAVKETEILCPILIKGVMGVVKEKSNNYIRNVRGPKGFQGVDRK